MGVDRSGLVVSMGKIGMEVRFVYVGFVVDFGLVVVGGGESWDGGPIHMRL